jgi:hypothetical protein
MGLNRQWTDAERDAVVREVCARHSQGETIASILRTEGMPSRVALYSWLHSSPENRDLFARAREAAMDAIADEAMTIANTPVEGIIRKESEQGVEITRRDAIDHRRLQVDTRLKLLAKWAPGRYGDRVQTDITSSDGSLKGAGDTESAARMAAILAAATARKAEQSNSASGSERPRSASELN